MELEQLVNAKTEIERRKERLLGKLESAKANLAELDRRLTERGINPDTLSEEIERLKAERTELTNKLATALEEAETIITRIENRVDSL
jgi:predicted nuclease with TOPRIM domain